MTDRIGQQWGNYRLIRQIGVGGFAEVYLGQHIRLKSQQAALKILSTHLNEADFHRFEHEAETIVSLIHPNIVRVLDFALNDGIPFLVLDYAPGGSLRQRHPRGERVQLATVVSYIQQISGGLQYAHDRKIIHRDIKPDNMLIGARGEILLSDFGIATIAHATSSQSAQIAMGTIPYMAPEQIREHPRPASDQYALAITVYEWLTGYSPFTGTFTEVAAKHVMVPPPPLRTWVSTLPSEVEQVVLTALAKEPKERFGSVEAFTRALAEASRSDKSDTTIAVPPMLFSQNQFLPTSPAISVSEPIFTPTSVDQVESPPPPPITPAPVTSPPVIPLPANPSAGWKIPNPVTPLTATPPGMSEAHDRPVHSPNPSTVDSPVPSTDQTKQRSVSRRAVVAGLVALGVVAAGGSVFAWNASHSQQTLTSPTPTRTTKPTPTPAPPPFVGKLLLTYTAHTGAVRTIDWSPDSKLIVSGAEDKKVRIWNPTTGATLLTYAQHPAELLSVAWSPDGTLIASGGRASAAQVWDASTGALIRNYRGHTDDVHGLAWSLDSKLVATGSDDHSVQVWDARTGTLVSKYTGHRLPVEAVEWSPTDANLIATACDDHTVQIVNAQTGTLLRNYAGHTDWVLSARWSPDGTLIASAGRDKTLQVWNASTGAQLFVDTSHTYIIEKVAWSPDGKLIASVGDDKTVQVLEVSTRKLVFNQKMALEMYALAWSPNGKFIATGGNDKAAEVWSTS